MNRKEICRQLRRWPDEMIVELCAEFGMDAYRPPSWLLGEHLTYGLIQWAELQGQLEHLVARMNDLILEQISDEDFYEGNY